MRVSLRYLLFFTVFIFVACGPSDEEKAHIKLNIAKNLLAKHDTTGALAVLDSIPKLYPKAVYSVNAAKNITGEINFSLMERKDSQLDSVKAKIAKLEKNFVKEKTEYDRYTQYIHKRQTFKRAWDRSYIQVHLNERGDIYLSSNYHGKDWLNHYALRVYDKGESAKTDSIPLNTVDNHHSDFMEAKWEKVTYRNGKDNGVIEFIAKNTDRRLKAVFIGKRYYYIILETYDKEAVRDALALSKAIKARTRLEAEIKQLQKKLNIK